MKTSYYHLPRVSDPLVHERLEDPDILSQVPEDPPHVADRGLAALTRWGRVAVEQDFPYQSDQVFQLFSAFQIY